MKLPESVEVGGFTYKIRTDKESSLELKRSNCCGLTKYDPQEIFLDTDMSQECLLATFLHETIHAIDRVFRCGELTEDQVHSLANGLQQILKDMGITFEVV